MRFYIISAALTVLTTCHLTLAAPATPNEQLPAAPPAGVELHNATAGYDATHAPVTERDLEARAGKTGKGRFWRNADAICRGGGPIDQNDYVVGLSRYWLNYGGPGASCGRNVAVQNQGLTRVGIVVGACEECGKNDVGMSAVMWKKFTQGDPSSIDIKWDFY